MVHVARDVLTSKTSRTIRLELSQKKANQIPPYILFCVKKDGRKQELDEKKKKKKGPRNCVKL